MGVQANLHVGKLFGDDRKLTAGMKTFNQPRSFHTLSIGQGFNDHIQIFVKELEDLRPLYDCLAKVFTYESMPDSAEDVCNICNELRRNHVGRALDHQFMLKPPSSIGVHHPSDVPEIPESSRWEAQQAEDRQSEKSDSGATEW